MLLIVNELYFGVNGKIELGKLRLNRQAPSRMWCTRKTFMKHLINTQGTRQSWSAKYGHKKGCFYGRKCKSTWISVEPSLPEIGYINEKSTAERAGATEVVTSPTDNAFDNIIDKTNKKVNTLSKN